jgi:hypothetical protein
VREGNHGSLPSHTRAAGFLPRMLPATQGHGSGIRQKLQREAEVRILDSYVG